MSATKQVVSAAARPAVLAARLALPALLLVSLVIGACYALMTPLFEVSDELWHYPMVKTLADGHGLPVQVPNNPGPWRQEGSQPPLYYAAMALATAWIDTSDLDQVRWLNPHADNGVITADGNNNIILHTYREREWPWRGAVLAVRLIRLLSVLMGAGTAYFTYRLALEVLPDGRGVALAAAGFTAFNPMFAFISASVNNDNLAILLSSAALWLAARWIRGPAQAGWRQSVVMGLLLGGAALSKVSALGLWPLAGLALLYSLWPSPPPSQGPRTYKPSRLRAFVVEALPPTLTMAFAALAVSGWWFWRNYRLYGDWLGWNTFIATVGARAHPATLAQLWGERVGFMQAFWGLFGGVSVPMPGWTYLALNLMAFAAVLGLVLRAAAALFKGKLDSTQVALWTLLVAWVLLIVIGLLRWTSLTWASQGRLIFPAIAALSTLMATGLHRLWRGLPLSAAGAMAALAAAVPFWVIGPHYQPPPRLTPQAAASIAFPLNGGAGADFGGEMRLLGYDLETPGAMPGQPLRLTLYWQSQIAMDRNWSIFVHVVDEDGIIVAQRDRYPGMGSLATSLLAPGQGFADYYEIPLPEAAYAPIGAHLEVGLYDLSDGARLPVAGGGDAFTLAPVAVLARPALSLRGLGEIPNPLRQNFGDRVELLGYAMDRRVLSPGQAFTLTLYWTALAPIGVNYSVFAHVRGEGETLWARADGWPQQGAAPTSAWRPGEVFADPYVLVVQPDAPPDTYEVEVGLYDSLNGIRLQAIADDGRPTDLDYAFLSRVRVTP